MAFYPKGGGEKLAMWPFSFLGQGVPGRYDEAGAQRKRYPSHPRQLLQASPVVG